MIENVPALADGKEGNRDVDVMTRKLESFGYLVYWSVIEARHFGSPAARERLYMFGIRERRDENQAFGV